MFSTQPVPQPSNTTPAANAAAGVIGVSIQYARGDHAHPFGSGAMTFQNAADAGHQFQRGVLPAVAINTADGAVFSDTSGSLSWPATFATTPTVQHASYRNSDWCFGSRLTARTTTAVAAQEYASQAGGSGQIEIWGLG